MSRAPAGMALPQHVAQERQIIAMAEAQVKSLHIAITKDVYARIVSNEYSAKSFTASRKAAEDADPYNTLDDEIVQQRLKEAQQDLSETTPKAVDVNAAAKASIRAANCLLFHLGMIDDNGRPIVEIERVEEPARPAGEPSGIILGT